MRDKILVSITSGLGNRIKCIANSLYQTTDVKILWHDKIDNTVAYSDDSNIEPFKRLFDSPIEVVKNPEYYIKNGYEYYANWRWNDDIKLDFSFDQTNRDYKDRYHRILWRYLKPSARVYTIYNKRIDMVRRCDYGAWIRTGDLQRYEYKGYYQKIESYEIGKNDRAFIVGDSPIVTEFFENYPNVVHFREKNHIIKGWPSHFANVLLLAQFDKLKLAHFSTYSDIVCGYNGWKAEVFCPPTYNGRAYPLREL